MLHDTNNTSTNKMNTTPNASARPPLSHPSEAEVLDARGAFHPNASPEAAGPILSPHPALDRVVAFGPLSIGIAARRRALGLPHAEPTAIQVVLDTLNIRTQEEARAALADARDGFNEPDAVSRREVVSLLARAVESLAREACGRSVHPAPFLGFGMSPDGYHPVAIFGVPDGPPEHVQSWEVRRDSDGLPFGVFRGVGVAWAFLAVRVDPEALARFARSASFGTNGTR